MDREGGVFARILQWCARRPYLRKVVEKVGKEPQGGATAACACGYQARGARGRDWARRSHPLTKTHEPQFCLYHCDIFCFVEGKRERV